MGRRGSLSPAESGAFSCHFLVIIAVFNAACKRQKNLLLLVNFVWRNGKI